MTSEEYINKSFLDALYGFDNITNIYSKTLKWVSIAWLSIITVSIPFLIGLLNKKKKAIQNPINNNSYSVITLYIINISIASFAF